MKTVKLYALQMNNLWSRSTSGQLIDSNSINRTCMGLFALGIKSLTKIVYIGNLNTINRKHIYDYPLMG